jgi:15-cis-phytoene synthase
MSQFIYTWEKPLNKLAFEALEQHASESQAGAADQTLLENAYLACTSLTREHSRTFFLASALLPEEKRHAVRALYGFCRVSDDLVDRAQADPHEKLEAWRQCTVHGEPDRDDAVALAWADTRRRYRIPWRYAEQLIQGVAQDMVKKRYASFAELAEYCYGVACTVGLMSMHIVGYQGRDAFPYAIRLGVALQLTNILRDVGEDWRAGRIYLPEDELTAFGLSEADIAAGLVTEKWRAFMRYQIQRNRRLYEEAMPGVAMLDRDGRFSIAAAAELYQAILQEIEANDYDVFHHRASVSKLKKISKLPGIWLRAMRGEYPQSLSKQNKTENIVKGG